jgi:Fe-S-cluster-containing hydrogenase component 2
MKTVAAFSRLQSSSEGNMSVIVKKERCPQDHKCPAVKVCPVNALSQQDLAAPVVDAEKCIDCGKCADACPTGALKKR